MRMLYRQKVLLALLEAFGGTLDKTDCQKLLFLYSTRLVRPSFDFFPHKFGCFSILSYRDKARLIQDGLLKEDEAFRLTSSHGHIERLHPGDRSSLRFLTEEIRDVRGRSLIRIVYLAYPEYAMRSTITSTVLTSDECKFVQSCWPSDVTPCLATFGYEGMSIDAFLNTLIQHNIDTLIDVRFNAHSMKYGFSKKSLERCILNAGLKYFHIPSLGIPSSLRAGLTDIGSYRTLFHKYESDILPAQQEGLAQLRSVLEQSRRASLMCFESDHSMCHRHKITEHLQTKEWFTKPVIHLSQHIVAGSPTTASPSNQLAFNIELCEKV